MLIYLSMIENEEDKEKFEEVYALWHDKMYGVAMKDLKNPHDAEDVLIEAFTYIAKNMDKIDDPKSKKTLSYVCVVTKHFAIDEIRRRKRVTLVNYDDLAYAIGSFKMTDDTLTNAILKLPEKHRQIIFLKYYHGYAVKEIAKMYGMKYDATQKLLFRIKKGLETKLSKEDL